MTPPLRHVLITGGAGFIGTHLAERFSREAEVVLLDNFRRNALALAPQLQSHPRVRIITADVLDRSTMAAAFEGVDTVIHLAAIAGVSSYYKEPLRTLQVNVLGTVNALEEAVAHRVKRWVYFSTSEVFGPNARLVDEQAPHAIGPVSDLRWVYATSKLAGEQFSLRTAEQHGIACTVIRPFNVYGPRQVGEGAVSNFCQAVVSGQPMTVYGDGAALRAWCFITDMVDAVEAVLRTPAAAGEVFNIGNPDAVETTAGLAQRLVRVVPHAKVEFKQMERTEVRERIPVIGHARRVLGFRPQVDLDSGLQQTLAWFTQQREAAACGSR